MNKIFIFGISGSGKTTFSKRLGDKLKIKAYDLDDMYFKEGKEYINRDRKKRNKILEKIIKKKNWIIEGSHTEEWISPIFKNLDLIIVIDTKLSICKRRIIMRSIKRKFTGSKKEKLPFVIKMIKKFVSTEMRTKKLTELKKLNKRKTKVIILKNKKQINNFINSLK